MEFSDYRLFEVEKIKDPGYYADGAGLWLQVSPSGAKSWIFRFMLNGRAREMGLGSFNTFSLAEARAKAADCRKLLHDGIDPIEARKAQRNAASVAVAKTFTFDECAKAYIASHRSGWKNAKHADQWENTLRDYVSPVFGSVQVASVDTALVMKALERDDLWTKKAETASRLRGRMEKILNWATVRGYRMGDNPARWKGHLQILLPIESKASRTQHHPALPYKEIGDFFEMLRVQEGIAAKALEFTILTAARTGEVIRATWSEVNFDDNVWTIPAERMKAKKEHWIPLPSRAIEILGELKKSRQEKFIFAGRKEDSALSNMAMLQLLKRIGRGDLTVHGFRSTFRDWAGEISSFPREVIEHALAHQLEDKAEASYARGTLFEKRRLLMQAWQKFCETQAATKSADVVPIRNTK